MSTWKSIEKSQKIKKDNDRKSRWTAYLNLAHAHGHHKHHKPPPPENNPSTSNNEDEEGEDEDFDYNELGTAGEVGSVITDLHDAMDCFHTGQYSDASVKCIRAFATMSDFESVSAFLSYYEDGSDLMEMYNNEQYLPLMSKLLKLIPPTGEPEIDLLIAGLKVIEWDHMEHAVDAWRQGNYREVGEELWDAFLPKSFEDLLHKGASASTFAPVAVGVTAGYCGYRKYFGYGMRSNFLLGSFFTTFSMRMIKKYKRNSSKPHLFHLYTSLDEHFVFT